MILGGFTITLPIHEFMRINTMMRFMRINNMMIGPIELLIVAVIAGTFFIGALIAIVVLIRSNRSD